MPKATDIRTKTGGGLTAKESVSAGPTANSSSTSATGTAAAGNASGQTGAAVKEVVGRNLGAGHGVFAGANNGKSLVTLDYRSLMAGPGINLITDAETITIAGTGTLTNDINNLDGTLRVENGGTGKNAFGLNSILLGNAAGPLQELTPPAEANKMLSWDGATYAWVNPQTSSGTVTSVGLTAGSSKVTVTGATITSTGAFTVDVNESAIGINNLSGTLSVTKGGTGATSLAAGALVVGNGTGAVTVAPLPSSAGQVLSWSGTAYTWSSNGVTSVTATGSNGVTATASTTNGVVSLAMSLGASGVVAGTYTYPTVTVDAQGRVTSASSNTIPTVSGQNLGTGGIGLFAGKSGDNLTFKQVTGANGVSVTTTADTVTVGLGVVPMANGGTGSSTYTAGSLVYTDATGFKSVAAAPAGQTTMLSHNGTAMSWVAAPTTAAVASSSTAITSSAATASGVTTYTLGFAPANVPLNNLGGSLDVTKGGTGATSLTAGGLLVGNGTGAVTATSAPGGANRYLRWSGTAFEWVEILPSGVQSITAGQGLSITANSTTVGGSITTTGSLNIADTGVTAGTYAVLSGTVNAKGQLTSASDASATVLNRANHTGNTPLNAVTGTLAVTNGGTGISSLTGQANKMLVVNSTANGYAFADQYSLPRASAATLGGIRVGSGLAIDGAGILSTTAAGFSGDYNDLTNKPSLATVATTGSYNDLTNRPAAYALPTATNTVLGGVKIGSGLSIDAGGVLSAIAGGTGTVTSVGLTAGSTKVSVTGSPITSSGTITVDVNEANLTLANMSGNLASTRITGLSTVATTGSYADLVNRPTLFSGSYNDLTNKPTLFSGAYADLTDKPVLATVATSGSYNDLSNKPTIPAPYTLPTASNTVLGGVKVGTGLAIDAEGVLTAVGATFSGSYNDLTDKPVLFSGAYADLTGAPVLHAVATTGSYTDLVNRPTLFSGSYTDLTNKPTLFSGAYSDLTGAPLLATVATTGAYADLTGKPTPFSGNYNDLTNRPFIPTQYTDALARAAVSIVAGTSGITYNNSTGVFDFSNIAAGSGEANTGANVGAGEGAVFKDKSAAELRFRTLKAGSNITITQNADDITISSTASGGGGSSNPSGSDASGSYTFSSVMNAGNTTTNGADAATIGITGLPAGWTASCAGGVTTITHTVGRPPRSVNFYVGTGSTTNPNWVFVSGGNAAGTGLVKVPASGTTALETTRFSYQLASGMATMANGTVHIVVTF